MVHVDLVDNNIGEALQLVRVMLLFGADDPC